MKHDANLDMQALEDVGEEGRVTDAREFIRERGELAANEQPQRVIPYDQETRYGGVAVELRSQQFHYPFSLESPALRVLPSELITAKDPFSDRAEEFRALRRSILGTVYSTLEKPALAVLSAESGDGKSYLAANLAVSFSQLGGRTLLIDANLRNPSLHRLLGTRGDIGLTNLLAGDVNAEAVIPVNHLPGLHFLGAGLVPANPVRLLQGARFSLLLEQLVDRFDYVLVDTPSHDKGPDARLIAARAGAALIVGRRGHSRVGVLQRLLSQLHLGPSFVAGVVMNEH